MHQVYFKNIGANAPQVEPIMLAELQAELNELDAFTDWDQNQNNIVNIDPLDEDLKFNISLIEEFDEEVDEGVFNKSYDLIEQKLLDSLSLSELN